MNVQYFVTDKRQYIPDKHLMEDNRTLKTVVYCVSKQLKCEWMERSTAQV